MSKINSVITAFLSGQTKSANNTTSTGTELLLHGNRIAFRMPTGEVYATLAGHPTVTTRRHLNALCGALNVDGFFQQQGRQMFVDRSGIANEISDHDTVSLTHSTAFHA